MTPLGRIIFLISADAALTQQLVSELVAGGQHYQLPLAASLTQAHKAFRRVTPAVILLDESALRSPKALEEKTSESLGSAAARLTESAPLVVVAAPERQAELAFLISSGAADFVARADNFVPVAVALLERRVRLAERMVQAESGSSASPVELATDFGEILRHEVNNPLTGILGNAELLLAECKKKNGEQLSLVGVQRLQTIAELAVRLREIIRRLGNAWDGRHDHARSA